MHVLISSGQWYRAVLIEHCWVFHYSNTSFLVHYSNSTMHSTHRDTQLSCHSSTANSKHIHSQVYPPFSGGYTFHFGKQWYRVPPMFACVKLANLVVLHAVIQYSWLFIKFHLFNEVADLYTHVFYVIN